ncbi:DUF3987 domain-containing protein [Thiocapsa rosea]|uniref:Uncharacterized protein DUF3987 n=1 Tax=Thiocapsa rosea TaxID=69360 RepID=A0A495VDX8_9GAMM|nr:DUF3987 domain-containing protein [Thiocapsa rosea]RKT46813.1 uncharacterized protein DUF3987 [Thiocapsa rosea]
MSSAAIDLNQFPPEVAASMRVQMPSAANEAEPAPPRGNLEGFEVRAPEPPRIDIKDTAARALSSAEAICRRWLPDGKRKGSEWVSRNPTRADKNPGSFSVSLTTGLWSDFATGDKGDLVALVAYLDGTSQAEAARTLAEWIGTAPIPQGPTPAPKRTQRPMATRPTIHPTLGAVSKSWDYMDASGSVLCAVLRFETTDKEGNPDKEFRPITRTAEGWFWKAPAQPRPLYGLDRLAARPDAPVILAEGEKAADAAGALLPESVHIASMMGAKSPTKTNWTPLSGRVLRIWPDADEPGSAFAREAATLALAAGALSVEVLDLSSLAESLDEGWDAADALAEGWTPERIAERARFVGVSSERKAPAEPEHTSRKLTQVEAEQLIAWSWRTGKALPPAREQFESDRTNPKTGKPFDRLRVRIGIGDNSGPWCSLGWQSQTAAEFIERADAQIDTRFSKDTGDKETAGPDDFGRHARQWAESVAALKVSGEAARELLERITPPWPEPQPITVKVDSEPYPLDALPATVLAAVNEVHGFVKAPLPMVASSSLSALSLAMQAHYDVRRAEKLSGPVSLYQMTIADSGERKTTVDAFFGLDHRLVQNRVFR